MTKEEKAKLNTNKPEKKNKNWNQKSIDASFLNKTFTIFTLHEISVQTRNKYG